MCLESYGAESVCAVIREIPMTTQPQLSNRSDVRSVLEAMLAQRIVILDGAMGTMVQRRKLKEEDFRGRRFARHPHDLRGNFDALVLTQPSIVSETHEAYFSAGADIVETDTFNANAIAQADYGLESIIYELNCEAAKLAKDVAKTWSQHTPDRPRFVAGCYPRIA